MKSKLESFSSVLQKVLFYISFYVNKLFVTERNGVNWVVGVDEIASMVYFLGNVVKPSVTISFSKNRFYKLKYDYHINIHSTRINYLVRIIYGPILLGYLIHKSSHFWYIWSSGFLLDRDFEFKILESKGKKIVCMFVGDDIRTPKLMLKYCDGIGFDTFVDYVVEKDPNYLTDSYHNKKLALAKSADKYADVIFNASVDQKSFITKKQYFPPYMYDEDKFFYNADKFNSTRKIKILHAPSSPLVKGTPLVRAAIKKLRIDGYDFEYVELKNVSNENVLDHLRTTNIVLNQFYAFVPGVFGIESMANHCAVLQSANQGIETGLPDDCRDAWLITQYWEIYENLKYLLDNPEKIRCYADNGYNYCLNHHTYDAASNYINNVLQESKVFD